MIMDKEEFERQKAAIDGMNFIKIKRIIQEYYTEICIALLKRCRLY